MRFSNTKLEWTLWDGFQTLPRPCPSSWLTRKLPNSRNRIALSSWPQAIDTTTYDRLYRDQVKGMVLIDPGSQYLQTVLPPDVWNTWTRSISVTGSKDPKAEQPDYPASIAFLRSLPPLTKVPTVVLTSDKPIDFLGNGRAAEFQPRWIEAQRLLAHSLGGKQITKTKSGHFIQSENPALVITQTKAILAAARARS